MSPRAATYRAMDEVSGPVVAVGCVLTAVFVPCAFMSGITGQFFRQFALTIAVSTLISMFNSLTLSPALCAILLKPRGAHQGRITQVLNFFLGWFFRLFNFTFSRASAGYTRLVRLALRGSVIVLVLYVGLLALTGWAFTQIPTGYIPGQDRGYVFLSIQMPDSTSLERTIMAVREIEDMCHEEKGVAHTIAVGGQSFVIGAFGPNFGQMFIILDEFHDRRDQELNSELIAARLKKKAAALYPDAIIAAFGPAPISGLGTSGGFKYMLEDRGDQGLHVLEQQTQNLMKKATEYRDANGEKVVTGMFTSFKAKTPQIFVDVDRDRCALLGINVVDVYNTLQIYLGSLYVNDFNLFDHTWQVNVQALGLARKTPEQINRLYVRSKTGGMVPLGTLVKIKHIEGPLLVNRYNMYTAVTISGNLPPGVSTGQSIDLMQKISNEQLPKDMSYEWTEITYLQLIAGDTATLIFALSVVGVFLVLAALYESWTLPLAVILVVPMCLLGSLAGVWLTKADINIFTQIGFVVLVGLASKNAILIVEFAKLKRDAGVPRRAATLEACQLRLRPILMTSFAFIFGVIPLMLSVGAGSEMRRLLGTAVFSGMLGVTLFGIFLTPVFFFVIDWLGEKAIFGSALTRRLLLGAALTLGAIAILAAEALIVIAAVDQLLSVGGAVALSLGLLAVVALLIIVHGRRGGRPLSHQLPLFVLWPGRLKKAVNLLAGQGGTNPTSPPLEQGNGTPPPTPEDPPNASERASPPTHE
jgi:multidrug efflux pump